MRRKRTSGRLWMIALIAAALLLTSLIVGRIISLRQKVDSRQSELDRLNNEIAAAQEEKLDIENEIRYRETDEYIEDQAKELGLRYPDEMIIVPEDE